MNKLEADYAQVLDICMLSGRVAAWRFEAIKLQLAKRTWYTPDFLVILDDGSLEIHETKGHWEDDARVKIKVAAQQYPWFVFRAIQRGSKGRGWSEEVIAGEPDDSPSPIGAAPKR